MYVFVKDTFPRKRSSC